MTDVSTELNDDGSVDVDTFKGKWFNPGEVIERLKKEFKSYLLSPIGYVFVGLFLLMFSIFFSVHYLVLYYLLQPYNKNMQIKKMSYSIASFLTYYFSYVIFWDLVLSSLTLSIIGIIFTIIYIVLALFLVYRFAPRTFKIVS